MERWLIVVVGCGETDAALHLARSEEVAKVLISANADVNQNDKGGTTSSKLPLPRRRCN